MSHRFEVVTSGKDLFKKLREMLGDNVGDVEVGGEAPHDGASCDCRECRLSRFEMPLPPEGPSLVAGHLDMLKKVHDAGNRAHMSLGKSSVDITMYPLSPEAERAVLQYRVDQIANVIKTERALAALLPTELQPPPSVLTQPVSLEDALATLERGRADVASKLQQEKSRREARQVIKEAFQPKDAT